MDARGIGQDRLVDGVQRGKMDDLGNWTLEADKALVF